MVGGQRRDAVDGVSVAEVARRPAVAGSGSGGDRPGAAVGAEFEEGVLGQAFAEVIVAHVGGEEGAAVKIWNVLQVDGVA